MATENDHSGWRARRLKTTTAGAGGRIVVPTEVLFLLGNPLRFGFTQASFKAILDLLTFAWLCGIISAKP